MVVVILLAVMVVQVGAALFAGVGGGAVGAIGAIVRFQAPPPTAPLIEAVMQIVRWMAAFVGVAIAFRAVTMGLSLVAIGGPRAVLASKETIMEIAGALLLIGFALSGGGPWLQGLFQIAPGGAGPVPKPGG